MTTKVLAIPLCLLAALVCTAADKDKPPAPKLPLGKDTTYVVGPLDKDGYIDYETALNAELSKDITPEKNANVLLVQAFGPAPEGGTGFPLDYYRWLDIPVLPRDGDYIIGAGAYVTGQLGLTGERLEAFYEVQGRATQRPWAAKDCPPLAEWLKANEKPLALVTEAVKRPEYYNPLVSRRKPGEPSQLIETLLPGVQKCRELASLLTTRAMRNLKEGKIDAAWADLLVCHRLGRLITRGATLIEGLVGIAIGQIAHNSSLALLDHPDLTAKQAAQCLKDLQGLPKPGTLADKIGVVERMMGLDTLQNLRRNGPGSGLAGITNDGNVFPNQQKAFEVLDWTVVMQTMNARYDRLAGAMRTRDRTARAQALKTFEDELDAVKKDYADETKVKKVMEGKDAGKALGKALGEVLMGLVAPAMNKIQQAYDRADQTAINLQIAFALAVYRKDNRRYPAHLRDLAPKYLASVPDDVFTGKPLVYKPADKGYLFYSLGMDGKDNGGSTFGDDPAGDDLPVKMPLPPLKKR
ncbi:MAG TPA: hypothetical protein VGE74_06365 [Gemmata sp.]